jgi:hypothetical protein
MCFSWKPARKAFTSGSVRTTSALQTKVTGRRSFSHWSVRGETTTVLGVGSRGCVVSHRPRCFSVTCMFQIIRMPYSTFMIFKAW